MNNDTCIADRTRVFPVALEKSFNEFPLCPMPCHIILIQSRQQLTLRFYIVFNNEINKKKMSCCSTSESTLSLSGCVGQSILSVIHNMFQRHFFHRSSTPLIRAAAFATDPMNQEAAVAASSPAPATAFAALEGDSLNSSLTAMDWLPKMSVKEAGPDTDVDVGPQLSSSSASAAAAAAAALALHSTVPASSISKGDIDTNGKPPYRCEESTVMIGQCAFLLCPLCSHTVR